MTAWTHMPRETPYAPRPLDEYVSPCGAWRVGESSATWGTARPFYVMNRPRPGVGFSSTHHFRKRFATAEAAMRAVDAHVRRSAKPCT
jgi:hypothetical protein